MTDKIIRRDKLFNRLQDEFSDTFVYVKPSSPVKYADGDTTINIWTYHDDKLRIVCGMQLQVKKGPYKLWFITHPEWEKVTQFPVKNWADNGPGIGNGDGFYIETEDEIVEEIKAYISYYYDEALKQ